MTRDTVGYAYPPDPPESDDRCALCGRQSEEKITTWATADGYICYDCAESEAVDWLQSDAVQLALSAMAALDSEDVLRFKSLFGMTETDDGDMAVAVAAGLYGGVGVAIDYAPRPKEEGL